MWDASREFPDDLAGDASALPVVQYECLQCGSEPTSGLDYSLLAHPEVVEFYHDRGVDVRERPLWEVATFGTDHERVRSVDPFRATATFGAGDDELAVTVDETLTVVDTEVTVAGGA